MPNATEQDELKPKDRLDLLVGHYDGTFDNLQNHWKARNRLFMYALILLALIGIDLCSPGSLAELVNGYLKKKFIDPADNWHALDFSAVAFVVHFVLLCVVIQYYQRSIRVDRLYRYLQSIEQRICQVSGETIIAREGKAYFSRHGVPTESDTDERPLFLRSVGPLYTYVFPLILIVLMVCGIVRNAKTIKDFPVGPLTLLCCIAVIFYSILSVYWIRCEKKRDPKTKRPARPGHTQ